MQADKNTSIFLKDLADITMGQSPAGSSMNERTGMEFHQGKTNFGSVFLNCSKVKTNAPTKMANKDDIVICVRAPVGVVNITNRKICIGRGLAALSPKELVDRDYLFYALQASQKAVEKLAAGSTFSSIPGPELCKLELPKQTYEKQKSIGRALSSADKAIAILEKQISKYEHIKKSTEKMLLTPKPGWKEVKIRDCLDYEQPTDYIVHTDINASSGTTPVLTANKAFVLGYTDETNNIYNKGDTIIYDDFTMDMKYVTFPFKVKSSAMKILTPKGENNLYFMFALLKSFGLTQQEHARSYISKLEPMKILIPDPATQETIAENLYTIDSYLENLKHQLDKIKKLKQGLMSYFFG